MREPKAPLLMTFKKQIYTAPCLKNLVAYSYLLPNYHVKNSQGKKKDQFCFISLFVKKAYFACKIYGDWHNNRGHHM